MTDTQKGANPHRYYQGDAAVDVLVQAIEAETPNYPPEVLGRVRGLLWQIAIASYGQEPILKFKPGEGDSEPVLENAGLVHGRFALFSNKHSRLGWQVIVPVMHKQYAVSDWTMPLKDLLKHAQQGQTPCLVIGEQAVRGMFNAHRDVAHFVGEDKADQTLKADLQLVDVLSTSPLGPDYLALHDVEFVRVAVRLLETLTNPNNEYPKANARRALEMLEYLVQPRGDEKNELYEFVINSVCRELPIRTATPNQGRALLHLADILASKINIDEHGMPNETPPYWETAHFMAKFYERSAQQLKDRGQESRIANKQVAANIEAPERRPLQIAVEAVDMGLLMQDHAYITNMRLANIASAELNILRTNLDTVYENMVRLMLSGKDSAFVEDVLANMEYIFNTGNSREAFYNELCRQLGQYAPVDTNKQMNLKEFLTAAQAMARTFLGLVKFDNQVVQGDAAVATIMANFYNKKAEQLVTADKKRQEAHKASLSKPKHVVGPGVGFIDFSSEEIARRLKAKFGDDETSE